MAIELCERGSLKTNLELKANTLKMSDEMGSKIMKGVLEGLHYLHDKNIMHRDLKPDNILLCGRSEIESAKICDFGLATVLEPGIDGLTSELCGTLMYKAPEQI